MKNYVNAETVLPKELFLEVKKYIPSGMLYIPSDTNRAARRKLVIAMSRQGVPCNEISLIAGLCVRRINQIIKEEKNKSREVL